MEFAAASQLRKNKDVLTMNVTNQDVEKIVVEANNANLQKAHANNVNTKKVNTKNAKSANTNKAKTTNGNTTSLISIANVVMKIKSVSPATKDTFSIKTMSVLRPKKLIKKFVIIVLSTNMLTKKANIIRAGNMVVH